jgi:predicted enzyme related to lactoylglutathione lyase
MSDNPVVHFEMPYEDADRVAKFYEDAFGWDMTKMGNEMGGYVTAATADTDENRMVKTPGTINGGFYDIKMANAAKEPSVVIAVKDLDKAMAAVKAAGGEILREPEEIPGIGMWASFRDSEGNRVSILQPKPRDS